MTSVPEACLRVRCCQIGRSSHVDACVCPDTPPPVLPTPRPLVLDTVLAVDGVRCRSPPPSSIHNSASAHTVIVSVLLVV